MNKDQREIQRKLRILRYAEEIGHVAKTCRYFGIGRSSFYRWRQAYAERGEAGLVNAPPIPKWHANRKPPEREEKVIYLRQNTTSGLCGSFGILRVITTLECLTQLSHAFYAAMVSTDFRVALALERSTQSAIRNRFLGTTSRWTSSS